MVCTVYLDASRIFSLVPGKFGTHHVLVEAEARSLVGVVEIDALEVPGCSRGARWRKGFLRGSFWDAKVFVTAALQQRRDGEIRDRDICRPRGGEAACVAAFFNGIYLAVRNLWLRSAVPPAFSASVWGARGQAIYI